MVIGEKVNFTEIKNGGYNTCKDLDLQSMKVFVGMIEEERIYFSSIIPHILNGEHHMNRYDIMGGLYTFWMIVKGLLGLAVVIILWIWLIGVMNNDHKADSEQGAKERMPDRGQVSQEQQHDKSLICEKQCLKGCAKEVKAIFNDCELQILGMEMNKTDGATIASFRNQCLQHVTNDVHPACARKCRADCR